MHETLRLERWRGNGPLATDGQVIQLTATLNLRCPLLWSRLKKSLG